MIFALKQVIEKSLEFQKPCYINFVDFEQAFDSIDRDVMWKILDMYGLPEKFIRIIKQSYDGFSCCVRTTEGISPWFNVTTGVRQGCIWSTLLFNIVIDWILKKTNLLQSTQCGIQLKRRQSRRYPEVRETDFDYADDLALIDETVGGLQEQTDSLTKIAAMTGLKVSLEKTKVMNVCHIPDIAPMNKPPKITAYEIELEGVRRFTCLGSLICDNGSIKPELESRISKASKAFHKLKNIWHQRNISLDTKMSIYRSSALPCLLYSAETWTLTDTDRHTIDVFDMSCLRSISGIRMRQHKTNDQIRGVCSQPAASKIVQRAQLRWYGHVLRRKINDFQNNC